MDRLGKRAKKLGKNLSIGISAPLAAFGTLAVKRAADFETLRVALETATGSAEAGAEAFKGLQDFAATTPFQLEEVVSGFIKLKNRGMDPSREALIAYGNTAGAMGKSLDQMIEAVADASTFEFERLKEFGIKANQHGNKVTFTFRGVKTTVRKNAAEIEEYLKKIGNVDFAGGMEKQSRTIAGAFSNLQDSISSALDIIGTDIARSLDLNVKVRAFSDTINRLAGQFERLPTPVKDFAVNAGIVAIALGPLVTGVGQLIIGMGVMVALAPQIAAGFAAMIAAWPFALILAGATTLGIMMADLVEKTGSLGNALKITGAVFKDAILYPFQRLADLVTYVWGLLGSPPAGLKRFSEFSFGEKAANEIVNSSEFGRSQSAAQARATIRGQRDLYDIQQRAMKGDKAAIEILFKNPPPGMRTSVKSETNANVTVDQGISMNGE